MKMSIEEALKELIRLRSVVNGDNSFAILVDALDAVIVKLKNDLNTEFIPVDEIKQRITALFYMANDNSYTEIEKHNFEMEADNLIQLLNDLGYSYAEETE